MRLLLDTHALIWLMEGNPRLNERAHSLIDSAAQVFFSSASIWEVAIKSQLGKLRIDAQELVELTQSAGLTELPVKARHGVLAGSLPSLHRDPFDRMLIAQTMTEPMRLLTADVRLASYSELVITM